MNRARVLQEISIMRFEDGYEHQNERKLTVGEAAEILGFSKRRFRRWSRAYESEGAEGLYDRRLDRAAHNTAPVDEVAALLELFKTRYINFNVYHLFENTVTTIKANEAIHGLKIPCRKAL